jgi:hypothetical protein
VKPSTPIYDRSDDIAALRRKESRGTLDPAFSALLTAYDPDWSTSRYKLRWRVKLDLYRDFIAIHSQLPSETSKDTPESALGTWAGTQRNLRKRKALSQTRCDRLNIVAGHSWDPFADAWESFREQLDKFTAEHVRIPSKGGKKPGERELARWLHSQRTAARKGLLSAERRESLDQVTGLEWEPRGIVWSSGLANYRTFMLTEGRERVRRRDGSDEQTIAERMHKQRTDYRPGGLSLERVRVGNCLPISSFGLSLYRLRLCFAAYSLV